MIRPQLSLRRLFGILAAIAVGLAVLTASNAWSVAIFDVLLLLLGAAILAAIYRRDARRAFWVGFCLFGWAYFGLVWYGHQQLLVSDQLLTFLARRLGRFNEVTAIRDWVVFLDGRYPPFVFHGHLVTCVIVGLAGGLMARSLYRSQERKP